MGGLQGELEQLIKSLPGKDQTEKEVHDHVVKVLKKTHCHIQTSLQQISGDKSIKSKCQCVEGTNALLVSLYALIDATQDHPLIRYRQCSDVFPIILSIGSNVSELICKVTSDLLKSFKEADAKSLLITTELPTKIDHIFAFLIPETRTDLSGKVQIKDKSKEEILKCRDNLHGCCIDFCGTVSDQLKSTLIQIEKNKLRANEKFKPFLDCVVKQHLFVQRACALCREILLSYPEKERDKDMWIMKYKMLFPKIRTLMRRGKRIICSISDGGIFPSDFQVTVIPASEQIRLCRKNLKMYQKRKTKDLDGALKSIEISCNDIWQLILRGEKCVLPGNLPVGEDISIKFSSDEDSSDEVKESDYEEAITGSDSVDDIEDESDIIVRKMPYPEYKNIIKEKEDLSEVEILSVYDIKDIRKKTKIQIDHKREKLKYKRVGAKVLDNKAWNLATNIQVNNGIISMEIPHGDILVVYYEFPSGEENLSKSGAKVNIEEVSLTILPDNITETVKFKYKVFPTDNDRIEGYRKESPKEFDNIAISPGVRIECASEIRNSSRDAMTVSLPVKSPSLEKENNTFVSIKFNAEKEDFTQEIVTPTEGNKTLSFKIQQNVVNHIVTVKGKQTPQDKEGKETLVQNVLTAVKLLLGFKSKCKILTLFRVEQDDDECFTYIRIECIESQRHYLKSKNNALATQGWCPFGSDDESSDFLIDENSAISVQFHGNIAVLPSSRRDIKFSFIKNSSCFTKVEVEKKDKGNHKAGHMSYHLGQKEVDTKKVDWGYLCQLYGEFTGTLKKSDVPEKPLQNKTIPEVEQVVRDIYSKLTESERDQVKMVLSINGKDDAMMCERITVKVKGHKKGHFVFLVQLLAKLKRKDLECLLGKTAQM